MALAAILVQLQSRYRRLCSAVVQCMTTVQLAQLRHECTIYIAGVHFGAAPLLEAWLVTVLALKFGASTDSTLLHCATW